MIGVDRRKIWWTSGSRCEPHDGVGRSLGPTYRKSVLNLLSLMTNQKLETENLTSRIEP